MSDDLPTGDALVNQILDVFAHEARIDRARLHMDARADELGANSLDLALALFAIEDRFGVEPEITAKLAAQLNLPELTTLKLRSLLYTSLRSYRTLCDKQAEHDVLLDLHSFRSPGQPFVMRGPADNRGALEPFACPHCGGEPLEDGEVDVAVRRLPQVLHEGQRRLLRAGDDLAPQ